jgi:hypothetical protein
MVRTSSEQLSRVDYSVRRLMTSLEQMEYKNWRAYFFSVNGAPIQNITQIFTERNPTFRGKYRYITTEYFPEQIKDKGYTITDTAIQQCPPDAKWLLVTNADSQYSPKTFSYLDPYTDAIAMDFYIKHKLSRNHKELLLPSLDVFPHKEEACTKKHKICY